MVRTASQRFFTEIFGNQGTSFGLAIARKLHEEQTRFQYLEVYETETFGNLLVLDGCVMLTDRDNFLYHEMMAHPALFTHPEPREVAIIGGGDCGTLREVLKHAGVETAWLIEIDERVTRVAEQYFPALTTSNHDNRANITFADGVAWIQARPSASLDIIIVDATDPVGPAEELYSTHFLKECCRVLRDDGILVQQSESPLLHTRTLIAKLQADMKSAGFGETRTLPFPQPVYPSGWWSCTLASKSTPLTRFRQEAAENKAFETEYYNASIHQGALALPEFMRRALNTR